MPFRRPALPPSPKFQLRLISTFSLSSSKHVRPPKLPITPHTYQSPWSQMDPLDRQFTDDVATAPPTSTSLPYATLFPSPSPLVYQAVSSIDGPDSDQFPEAFGDDAEYTTTILGQIWRWMTPGRVRVICDVLAMLALSFMVLRTLLYVKHRRKGLVGPATALILIKFWALYGVIECGAHVLSLYMTPLRAVWLVSVLRTMALMILTWGRRLSQATRLYETRLAPFFESQAPEIEQHLTYLRQQINRVDDAFKELGSYLLKRMAVGGLSGVAMAFSELFSEALQHDLQKLQQANGEQQGAVVQAQQRPSGGKLAVARSLGSVPRQDNLFMTGRQFFAGIPEEKAKAIVNQSSADSLMGVMQTANAELPKAPYEEIKAMRRRFRHSRDSHTSKVKEGTG